MSYSNSGYILAAEIIRRVTGKNPGEFAKERLFDPLGMASTFFIVPDDVVPRIVTRKNTDPRKDWFSDPEWLKCPSAAAGAFSNINDMAVFGQMLLNKGIYNHKRILSPRAVELMTQNQIPGIKAAWGGKTFDEGTWSYGWNIKGNKLDDCGSYRSAQAFCHSGAGGVFLLIDPAYDLVFANFNLYIENSFRTKGLFTNLVISAIDM